MTKYVVLASDNRAAGFYNSAINAGGIPANAIQISDALWAAWIVDTAGQVYSGGALVAHVAPPAPAPSIAQLIAYAGAKQQRIATGGTQVNIGASAAPQMVEASTDALSLAWLNGAAALASGNAAATFSWSTSGGSVTLTSAQVLTIYSAVQSFIQASFATLGAVVNAINAGTITTTAQIDAPPAPIPAWPVNS